MDYIATFTVVLICFCYIVVDRVTDMLLLITSIFFNKGYSLISWFHKLFFLYMKIYLKN